MFTSHRSRHYSWGSGTSGLDEELTSEAIDASGLETSDVVQDHSAPGVMPDDDIHQTHLDAVDAAETRSPLIRRAFTSTPFTSQYQSHVPSRAIPRTSSQITPAVSSSPTCVCGTRRLCIGCITQGPSGREKQGTAHSPRGTSPSFDARNETESPQRPHRSSISEYLSGMAITADSPHRSMDDGSDAGSTGELQEEERRCLWGDGTCSHTFSLSRTQGQSSLVTIIKSHLDQCHPDIQTKTANDKYTCQWEGCQDPLATVTSISRHILTGKKHMDFGMPCPDCQEGSFRRDSLKIHRKRHSCKSRKPEA